MFELQEQKRKKERDALLFMLMTLFVSHFERSLLNVKACENTIKKEIFKRRSTTMTKSEKKKIHVKCLILVKRCS